MNQLSKYWIYVNSIEKPFSQESYLYRYVREFHSDFEASEHCVRMKYMNLYYVYTYEKF